jgi:3-dehydrocarnitine:acetyl-CoA trimethylamine transferase
VINTPGNVRRMAKVMRDAGVKPEIELFDSGDIALMHDLLKDGTLEAPALCSLVMGVRYGFQPGPETVLYARNLLPEDAEFTAIGIGKAAFTAVAQSYLAGGHVRVGLEDTVYLSRGQLASPTRYWSRRRAALSKTSAAKSQRHRRQERSLDCRHASPMRRG